MNVRGWYTCLVQLSYQCIEIYYFVAKVHQTKGQVNGERWLVDRPRGWIAGLIRSPLAHVCVGGGG